MRGGVSRIFAWVGLCAFAQIGQCPVVWAGDCEALFRTLESGHQKGKQGFNTKRDLSRYRSTLGEPFFAALTETRLGFRWMDGGSGETLALTEFFSGQNLMDSILDRAPNRSGEGVGITLRFADRPVPEKVWIFINRLFEEIADERLGQFDLITDLFGIAAYSDQPDEVLRRYFRLLKGESSALVFGLRGTFESLSFCEDELGVKTPINDWIVACGQGVVSEYSVTDIFGGPGGHVLRLNKGAADSEWFLPRMEFIRTVDEKMKPPIRAFRCPKCD